MTTNKKWIAIACVAALAACNSDRITTPGPNFSIGGTPANELPELGKVKVCTFDVSGVPGNGGGTFETSSNPAVNTANIEETETLGPSQCSIVFVAPGAGSWQVTVNQTGPAGFALHQISILSTDAATITETPPADGSVTVTSTTARGVAIWFKQNVAEEPPPEGCVGLTPGYWRNWSNHYTEAQFLSLLPGTIAAGMTAAQAKVILEYGGPSAILKLKKFVLANQLTLNLTGTDLPNPDGAGLTGTCEIGDAALGGTLTTALNILNGVGGPYGNGFINGIKDLLDAFANMD